MGGILTYLLPKSSRGINRAKRKLNEYQCLLEDHRDLTHQMRIYPITFYKTALLERVLVAGEVKTEDLCMELKQRFPDDFDQRHFNMSLRAVREYCVIAR